jgi:DNA-binding transcriptional ArsR family regulator
VLPEAVVDRIAERLSVVAAPLHIRLITYLDAHGATNVQTLADDLAATQQSVSKALARLYRSGIVTRRSEGRRVWYRLIDPTVIDLYASAADGLIHAASSFNRHGDVTQIPTRSPNHLGGLIHDARARPSHAAASYTPIRSER